MFQKIYGFTSSYSFLTNVIITETAISQAFGLHNKEDPLSVKTFDGLWDTGATHSAITQKVVDVCGLKPIGMIKISHAGGKELCERYLVNIILPNKVVIPQTSVTKANFGGADVLIGMDIISMGDFVITNFNGKTTFSFRIPSVERIDLKESKVTSTQPLIQKPTTKVGRNAPCPCGSGKKYKNCHGK